MVCVLWWTGILASYWRLELIRTEWFGENGWKVWRFQEPTGNQSIQRKTIKLLLNQRRREREQQSSWASPRAWKRFPRLGRRLVDIYDRVRAGFRVWDCWDYCRNIADTNHGRSLVGTRASIQMIPLHVSPAGSPTTDHLRFHNPTVCMYEHVLQSSITPFTSSKWWATQSCLHMYVCMF